MHTNTLSSHPCPPPCSAAAHSARPALLCLGLLCFFVGGLLGQDSNAAPAGFALIPGGTFQMGDTFNEFGPPGDLVHEVNVGAFFLQTKETTKAEWDAVRSWALTNGYTFNPGGGKAPDHPVHTVSWYDVVKWCNARSQKEGLAPCYYTDAARTQVYQAGQVDVSNAMVDWSAGGYRLPTEAEWEKAARGGLAGRRFPWGDTISHSQANYSSGSDFAYDTSPTRGYHPDYNEGGTPYTAPVGSFAPNDYGLYDMAGNVFEWCWDRFGIYDSASPSANPLGPDAGSSRVFRGGSWFFIAEGCRAADRRAFNPSRVMNTIGFRPARGQFAAQPTFHAQPGNASVSLGQDAQFTVTAFGSALTYQWRFDGEELAGATNLTLTVANVALSNLGRYDVVVSNSVGAVMSDPAWLRLARWTELVVFGRSIELPRCSGLAWPEYLANRLGIRLRNYAATVPTGFNPALPSSIVRDEINLYLSSNAPTTNTLVALWGGGNDLWRGPSVEAAVSAQLEFVRTLADAGARSFLLPTSQVPEQVPFWVANFPWLTSDLVLEYDATLTDRLKVVQAEYGLAIFRPNTFLLFKDIAANPASYGLSDSLGTDFLCDGAHYTTAVHRFISEDFARSLTPALRIDSVVRTLDGNMTLNWSGGSRPFRIERTSDLLSGQWEPVGELSFLSSATVKPASPQQYFRVLRLGQ